MRSTLEMRVTHGYVGSCSHLDKWESIGSYKVQRVKVRHDGDMHDGTTEFYRVRIQVGPLTPYAQIKQALRDSFSSVGCHCTHDCCGCRSFYADSVRKQFDGSFVVVVRSSRNY